MKFIQLIAFLIILAPSLKAQKVWSLDDCFNYALRNNISVKQIELSKEYAQNDLKQSKLNLYLPNINASISESFNFGNSIDPTTYQFVNSATNSTRFALSGSYNIFEGLMKLNSVKANKDKLSATESEIDELKNNTKLAITNLYLQIVIAKEVLSIANENKTLTQNQFKNTKALVDAGVLAKGALLDIDAQLAQNELNIINSENTLERALNKLKQLLQLDLYSDFEIETVEISDQASFTLDEPKSISTTALQVLPQMKSAAFRLSAAKNDLKTSKGSLWPTLSVSAFVGTNYFSAAQDIKGYNTTTTPINIEIAGNPVVIGFPSQVPNFEKTPFAKQLGNNLSENVAINLAIPILASWQRRTAIANAKLNIIKTELDIDSKKQQLSEDVFNAYTDLKMAYNKFSATEKNIAASNEAFKYAEEKYKVGMLNSLEFETAKNRKLSAKADQIQAKYEYFFRSVILNYYKTGEITL